MSVKTQQNLMQELAQLSRKDLGTFEMGSTVYSCQPTGDTKLWLETGESFLQSLAADLELKEFKVDTTPKGNHVYPKTSLIGMWYDEHGIYVELYPDTHGRGCVHVRSAKKMDDYYANTKLLSSAEFEGDTYEKFLNRLLEIKTGAEKSNAVALAMLKAMFK